MHNDLKAVLPTKHAFPSQASHSVNQKKKTTTKDEAQLRKKIGINPAIILHALLFIILANTNTAVIDSPSAVRGLLRDRLYVVCSDNNGYH
jgi:hypothetical protein